MSLLTNTAGTPARVHALLKLLEALEMPAPRPTVEAYMTTGSDSQDGAAFTQTLGAARDLGLIEEREGKLSLAGYGCPADNLAFSDLVHRRLTSSDVDSGDAVILDAFAYIAHKTDAGPTPGPHWFMDADRNDLADELRAFVDRSREAPGSGTFNLSRIACWKGWTELLGLTVTLIKDRTFPEITTRVAREIDIDALPIGQEVSAQEFIGVILRRMPYLPGGRRSLELLGSPLRDGVSDLLSAALRDLEADQVIELTSLGDAGNAMILQGDAARPMRSFNNVRRLATRLTA